MKRRLVVALIPVTGLVVAAAASLAVAAGAGAGSDGPSQAGQRVSGVISVQANIAQGQTAFTYTARAEFNVELTTNPDHFADVPLSYDWTGVDGSCRWAGRGADGQLRLRLRGIRQGRPLVEFSGSAPGPGPCDNLHPSAPNFSLYTGDDDERDGIAPEVSWGAFGETVSGKGTGTLSLQCSGCAAPPGSSYQVRALWFLGSRWKPRDPRPGQLVRMTVGVALLERSSTDTAWTPVSSRNVTAKCDVYYSRSRRAVTKATVRGSWRTPATHAGEVTCGPWRIPRSAAGTWMGVTPSLTYRGKTVTPVRGRGFFQKKLRR
jgi:hypothetical protein